MNSSWYLKFSSSPSRKIKCYIDQSELLNLQSRGYGVRVEGWIFHPEQQIVLNPKNTFISFSSGNERQDVLDAFGCPSSFFSGFQGIFYFLQGQKQLDLSFEIVNEQGQLLGTFCVELESPVTGVLQSLRWLRDNCNQTNLHVAWQMLLKGEVAKLWRFIQVAVSARQEEERTALSFLDLNLVAAEDSREPIACLTHTIDIIVPIFNGPELLESLLQSLKENTFGSYSLILVDDASTDARIDILLSKVKGWFESVLILRNEKNMGFVASVNRGLTVSTHDVVLLNSDTEVPRDWLKRLAAPLQKDRKVASVTPMTNAGSIASFPEFCQDNRLIFGSCLEDVDAVFQKIDAGCTVEVPTGVGFCMALRRSVLDKVGCFDEELFGRGYGEENDWCQRAEQAGFKNVILPSLFVWHKHGGSFTSLEKQQLLRENYQKLIQKHPTYDEKVQSFIRQDPLYSVRFLAFLFLAEQKADRSILIIIDHEEGGGANTYSNNLVAKESGKRLVVKVTYNKVHASFRLEVQFKGYKESAWLQKEEEVDLFFNLLEKVEFFYNNLVYYRNPEKILLVILKQLRKEKRNLTVAVHDYFPVCPSYVLLDERGIYCGIPRDICQCEKCLRTNRFSTVPAADIVEWRLLWQDVLQQAEKILVFSRSSMNILSDVYPLKPGQFYLKPHELTCSFKRQPVIQSGSELHVGVVGGINEAKGAKVVKNLVQEMERRDCGRLTVIGQLADVEISSKRLRVTGAYKVNDLPEIIEDAGVNIFFVPSVCPETFNYTVSELIELKVPLVCFDIGAPPERVEGYKNGYVLSNNLSVDALMNELEMFWQRQKALGVTDVTI